MKPLHLLGAKRPCPAERVQSALRIRQPEPRHSGQQMRIRQFRRRRGNPVERLRSLLIVFLGDPVGRLGRPEIRAIAYLGVPDGHNQLPHARGLSGQQFAHPGLRHLIPLKGQRKPFAGQQDGLLGLLEHVNPFAQLPQGGAGYPPVLTLSLRCAQHKHRNTQQYAAPDSKPSDAHSTFLIGICLTPPYPLSYTRNSISTPPNCTRFPGTR